MAKINHVSEQYAIYVGTAYEDPALTITWNDVRTAPIGTVWSHEDLDRWPNAEKHWNVEYTKVHETEYGCLVVRHTTNDEEDELLWMSYAK